MTPFPLDQPSTPRPGEELHRDQLIPYLQSHLATLQGDLVIEQFLAGHSNLTYLIKGPQAEVVLRRPPFGSTVRSGHDMEREFHVLTALAEVGARAPAPLLLCEDESVIGAPFYVMERVPGVILRGAEPGGGALDADAMNRVCEQLVRTMVEVHKVDLEAAGLGSFGKPEGYVARQVAGWSQRWLSATTDPIREMDEVAHWLAQHQPASGAPTLIHNDFKIDNLVLSPTLSSVRAVLDWEMATVGESLMDVGTALAYWVEPGDSEKLRQMRFGPTTRPGAWSRQQLVDQYALLSGRDTSQMLFYYVFGLFKVAVVGQQIYYRYKHGHTKDERFAGLIVARPRARPHRCRRHRGSEPRPARLKVDTLEAIFGEVRALCAGQPPWSGGRCRRLLQWLGQARRIDAELYDERFVPYLGSTVRRLPTVCFATVSSVEELEWVTTLLPGAVFKVAAEAEFDFSALGNSQARAWVRELELHQTRLFQPQASSFFQDLDLPRLAVLKCIEVQDVHRPHSSATPLALLQSAAAHPGLERLDFWAHASDMDLGEGICDHLPTGLERLLLSNVLMPPSGWQRLAGEGRLLGVRRLGLPLCGLTAESLDALLEAEPLRQAEHLSLHSNLRLGQQAQRLLCSRGPGRWRSLDLSNTQMRDAMEFGQCDGFENLEELVLQYGQYGPQESLWELAPLCFSEHFPSLRELNLSFTPGLSWAEVLRMVDHFGAPKDVLLGRVEVLRLWGCTMRAGAMRECHALELWPALRVLDLSHCAIGVREAVELGRMRAFEGVEEVVLTRHDMSAGATEVLEACRWGGKIRWAE